MYIHSSAFQNLLPGEPTPEALHRQEYYENRPSADTNETTLIDPEARTRAELLRAKITAGVGRYFA
jgi:hypothetical protein